MKHIGVSPLHYAQNESKAELARVRDARQHILHRVVIYIHSIWQTLMCRYTPTE